MSRLILVLALFLNLSTNVIASCNKTLENDPFHDVFSELEQAERKLQQLEPHVKLSTATKKELLLHYVKALKLFLQIESEVLEQSQISVESRVSALRHEISKAEYFLKLYLARKTIFSLNEVYDNPEVIVADRVYKITNPDDSLITGVSMSQDVVENIFWSLQDVRKTVAKQLLKLLVVDGFNRGVATKDIKRTISDRSIWMLGVPPIKAVGAYRFLAYLDGSVLRIVTWSNESNHGVGLKLFKQGFTAIRNDRLHVRTDAYAELQTAGGKTTNSD